MISLWGRRQRKAPPKPYVRVEGLELTAEAYSKGGLWLSWLEPTDIVIGPSPEDYVIVATVLFRVVGPVPEGAEVYKIALKINGLAMQVVRFETPIEIAPETAQLHAAININWEQLGA